MSADRIIIEKNGVQISVHPGALASYLKMGWWQVAPPKAEPAPKMEPKAEVEPPAPDEKAKSRRTGLRSAKKS